VHARLVQLPNVSKVKPQNLGNNTVAGTIGVAEAIAIPVIVRFGQTQATGSIASLKIGGKGKAGTLDLELARDGNRSLYVNLHLKDKSGAIASEIKGIAVPVPNKQRRFVYAPEGIDPGALKAGGYTIEMVDHDSGAIIDSKPVR
jgi:hypothetical protein